MYATMNKHKLAALAKTTKIIDLQPPTVLTIDGAESTDRGTWNDALKELGTEITLATGGTVKLKMARTAFNMKRNWALRQAADILKGTPLTEGKTVTIDWKSRKVSVSGEGAFVGRFASLRLR